MILAGNKSKEKITNEEVARLSLECLKSSVPSEVPGIAFLSGGQSSDLATLHLNLMNKILQENIEKKWNLTFSFGRALQQDSLNSWKEKNLEKSQEKLLYRAKTNSVACQGLIN